MGLTMIRWSLDLGWDKEHGGIYYFLDADGHSPPQLVCLAVLAFRICAYDQSVQQPQSQQEWSQKLWWVHNEAMVALLMAYQVTGDAAWWRDFEMVAEYSMTRFPDTAENNLSIMPSPGAPGAPAPPTAPG